MQRRASNALNVPSCPSLLVQQNLAPPPPPRNLRFLQRTCTVIGCPSTIMCRRYVQYCEGRVAPGGSLTLYTYATRPGIWISRAPAAIPAQHGTAQQDTLLTKHSELTSRRRNGCHSCSNPPMYHYAICHRLQTRPSMQQNKECNSHLQTQECKSHKPPANTAPRPSPSGPTICCVAIRTTTGSDTILSLCTSRHVSVNSDTPPGLRKFGSNRLDRLTCVKIAAANMSCCCLGVSSKANGFSPSAGTRHRCRGSLETANSQCSIVPNRCTNTTAHEVGVCRAAKRARQALSYSTGKPLGCASISIVAHHNQLQHSRTVCCALGT